MPIAVSIARGLIEVIVGGSFCASESRADCM